MSKKNKATEPFRLGLGVVMKFWHGSHKWSLPIDLNPPKNGRYEHGPGLYLSTSIETAVKYAKGGGSLVLLELDPTLVLLEDSKAALDDVFLFLHSDGSRGMRNKQRLMLDLAKSAERHPDGIIPLSYFVNLGVNNESFSGRPGVAAAEWLKSMGVDASLVSCNGHEDWLVLFSPERVLSAKKMKSAEAWALGDVPKFKEQLGFELQSVRQAQKQSV